jgi:hypothetical protein
VVDTEFVDDAGRFDNPLTSSVSPISNAPGLFGSDAELGFSGRFDS